MTHSPQRGRRPLFDPVAAEYDQWYQTPLGAFADQVEQEMVRELAQPQPGEEVLDLGCGTGTFSLPLARLGCRVTGVDLSPGMLERARAKAEAEGLPITWVQADARRLPFADGSFDLVVSVTALEFMPAPRAVLAEALRVLKPGGRLVVGLLGKGSQWEAFYRQQAEADPTSIFARARFYGPEEAAALTPGQPPEAQAAGLYVGPFTEVPPEEWPRLEEEEVRKAAGTAATKDSPAAGADAGPGAATSAPAPGFRVFRWRKPQEEPLLSVQVALHPLSDDYGAVVRRALEALDLEEVTVEVGAMSTTLTGPADAVWRSLRALWEAAALQGKPLAMVTTLSNVCGVPGGGSSGRGSSDRGWSDSGTPDR